MPIEPVANIAGACLIFAAGLGTRELVEWARGEIAFSRAIRGRLDAFAARFREETGQAFGPIDDVPPHVASPSWLRADAEERTDPGDYQPSGRPWDEEIPDDEDAYPRDEQRMQSGAWRRETVRGDSLLSAWPVNQSDSGRHRLPGDDTQDLTAVALAFREAEVAAP